MAQTSNHVNVILKHKLWKSCASKWVHVVTINKPMIYLCGREGKNLGLTKKKKKGTERDLKVLSIGNIM